MNSNLHKAKSAKNDEFYTQYPDIEKEIQNYLPHFEGKTVFLNCDDSSSNFWKFFTINFEFLKLKKVIATHYNANEPSYKLEMSKPDEMIQTALEQDGDFRSPESIELMKEADIVVTNPPFSIFREYIAQLVDHGKSFLVIGNKNAITYKELFSLIKSNKMWLGIHLLNDFVLPSGDIGSAPAVWFTNLSHGKRNEDIVLFREYTEKDYPTYDNYNAIEVSRVVDIPEDYSGVMGVPITFLTKYNPDQFTIIGTSDRGGDDVPEVEEIRTTEKKLDSCLIGGKKVYKRIFIKAK